MSRIMQFCFEVPPDEISFHSPCIVETQAYPLYRPKEMMQAVNQGGKIKIHMLVDASKTKRLERFLIIGTGHQIPDNLLESIRCVGHLLMNDGQFGIHVYHIVTHPEAGQEAPKKAKLTIEYSLHDRVTPVAAGEIELSMTLYCARHIGKLQWEPSSNQAGPHKVHVLKDSFLHTVEFTEFKDRLYQDPSVKAMKITKLV